MCHLSPLCGNCRCDTWCATLPPPRYRYTILSPCYRPAMSPATCHIVSLCYHPLCPTVLQPYRYRCTVAPRPRVFIQSWHRTTATRTLYDDRPGTLWHNVTIWTVTKNSNDLFNGFSISAMNFLKRHLQYCAILTSNVKHFTKRCDSKRIVSYFMLVRLCLFIMSNLRITIYLLNYYTTYNFVIL